MNTTPGGTPHRVCAITGTGGYLGGCLKDYFERHGWQVLELTRRPKTGARAIQFELGADLPPSALQGVTALVHCAYDFKPVRWEEIRTGNVDGAAKLIQAARTARVGRIVCISSISAYQGCRSLYGRAKLEMEQMALAQGAMVIRPGLIHGDHPQAMFGKLVAQVRNASLLPIIGDGSQIQYLIHQEDLAAFIEGYASGRLSPEQHLLTAAHPRSWTFREILLEIGQALNRRPRLIPVPWQLVWAGLKSAETLGLRLNFRSDSVVSLMHQNPHPDFSANERAGLVCRPFDVRKLQL